MIPSRLSSYRFLQIMGLPPKVNRAKNAAEVEEKFNSKIEQTCQDGMLQLYTTSHTISISITVFGFSSFRPKQKDIIVSILGGK